MADLVPTGVAAQVIGVDTRTLQRWATRRLVRPHFVTAGGHMRWNLNELRRQLAQLRDSHDDQQ